MSVLYVASDRRGAGKTALCSTLAHELGRQGKRAAVFKPFPAAGKDEPDPDAGVFTHLLGQPATGKYLAPPRKALTTKLLGDIKRIADKALEDNDVLLVEGSPAISDEASRQMVEALDARVLVVAKFEPGLDASELAGWRELFGDRLLGVVINGRTRYQGTDVADRLMPSMEAQGLPTLGVIPEHRRLLAVTVGHLASHLNGRFIVGEESSDRLVEHFLVGGPGMDPGELYFSTRENKAVIIRGDRPDIQMAALPTPTACMLLTQGIEPIEYVINEAELEMVPIVVVQSDTLTTMASLESLQDGARFDHPAKLDTFADLLREHVDLPAIFSGLGLAA
jgi:BioD-like phosphotransacetylase family protein